MSLERMTNQLVRFRKVRFGRRIGSGLACLGLLCSGLVAAGGPAMADESCKDVNRPECYLGPPSNVVAEQLSPFDRDGVRVTWDAPIWNPQAPLLAYYQVFFEPWIRNPDNPTSPPYACPITKTLNCDIRFLPDGTYTFWVRSVAGGGRLAYAELPSNSVTVPFSTKKQTKYQKNYYNLYI